MPRRRLCVNGRRVQDDVLPFRAERPRLKCTNPPTLQERRGMKPFENLTLVQIERKARTQIHHPKRQHQPWNRSDDKEDATGSTDRKAENYPATPPESKSSSATTDIHSPQPPWITHPSPPLNAGQQHANILAWLENGHDHGTPGKITPLSPSKHWWDEINLSVGELGRDGRNYDDSNYWTIEVRLRFWRRWTTEKKIWVVAGSFVGFLVFVLGCVALSR